jgi:hypothetical protein
MKANINEDELKLLACLRENARGYSDDFQFDPALVQSELNVPEEELVKNASYLASHGLIGLQVAVTRDGCEGIGSLWLTGTGEDYMRELDAAPGIARKVTVAVVAEMGKTLRDIAVAVLSNHFTR